MDTPFSSIEGLVALLEIKKFVRKLQTAFSLLENLIYKYNILKMKRLAATIALLATLASGKT